MSDFSVSLLWRLLPHSGRADRQDSGRRGRRALSPAADRRQVRAGLGLPLDSPLLFTVRNLEARMGLDTLIAAMVGLARRSPGGAVADRGGGLAPRSARAPGGTAGPGQARHVSRLHPRRRSAALLPGRRRLRAAHPRAGRLRAGDRGGAGLRHAGARARRSAPPRSCSSRSTPRSCSAMPPPRRWRPTYRRFLDRLARHPGAALACARPVAARPSRASAGSTWWTRSSGRSTPWSSAVRWPKRGRPPARPAAVRWCSRGCSTTASAIVCASGVARAAWPSCPPPPKSGASTSSAISAASRPGRSLGRDGPCWPPSSRGASLAPPGRLLDVGCGGGHSCGGARRRLANGRYGSGTRRAPPPHRRAGGAGRRAALPFASATFDALTLVNVLDHTIHPLRVAQEAARVLRPGGLLVVRIPNAAFHAPWAPLLAHLGPLVRWRRWDAYPILHLFALSPRSVRRLVERAGFDVVTLRNSTLAAAAPDAAATRRGSAGRRILRTDHRGGGRRRRRGDGGPLARGAVDRGLRASARRRALVIGVDHVITRLTWAARRRTPC